MEDQEDMEALSEAVVVDIVEEVLLEVAVLVVDQ
jgi:hypothetical protein